MSDERIICKKCGRPFIWSYGEQRFYKERGLDPPKHCPECRPLRRAEFSKSPQVDQHSGPTTTRNVERRASINCLVIVLAALAVAIGLLLVWRLFFW